MRKSTRYYFLALVVTLSLWKVNDSGGFSPDYNSGSILTPPPPLNVPTIHPNMLVRDPAIYAHYNSAYLVFKDTASLTNFPTTYATAQNDSVGEWQDLAGSWTLTTTSTSTAGSYNTAGSSNSVQGLASVIFNQSTGLASTTGFWDPLIASGYTIIILTKPQGTTSNYRILINNLSSGSYYFGFRPRVSTFNSMVSNINTTPLSTSFSNVNTGNQDDAALTGNSSVYQNGVALYWTVSSTNFVTQGVNGTELGRQQASSGATGGALGVGDGAAFGFPGQSPMVDINIYRGVMTQTQIRTETSRILSLGTIQTPLVICDWNSFGIGYIPSAARNDYSCPAFQKALLGNPNTVQLSVSGQTTLQKVTASLPTVKLLANQNSYRKTAYLLWEGTNDMHSGTGNKDAATAWANYAVMITSAAQYGVRDIFVGTVICRNDGQTFEDRRLEFNALVRNNAPAIGSAYGVNVNVVDIPVLLPQYNVTTSTANTVYYVDGVHPSKNGYAAIANEWAKAIQNQWYKETTVGF